MLLSWYGHSCFLMTFPDGVRILTDPCAPDTGYRLSGIPADAVTLSHDHHDHNYAQAASGAPAVFRDPGQYRAGSVTVTGYPSFHDNAQGRKRGANTIFLYDSGPIRLAHLGDLGDAPQPEVMEALTGLDVLFLPIGGCYTIDAGQALALARQLRPRLICPMHYQTPALAFPLAELTEFTSLPHGRRILQPGGCQYELTADTLREPSLLILDYVK